MADLQVPPAVGTSGQRLDTIVINAGSTIFRQTIVVGDPLSSGNLGKVDSAGNQLVVSASSGIVQVQTTGPLLVVSASSGLVQVLTTGTYLIVSASSGLVQTLTSGPMTISGTVTILSASSGLVQTLTSGPIVTASSGQLGVYPSTGKQYSVFAFNASSSNSITNVTAAQTLLYGWNVGNQTTSAAASIKLYNSTAPTAGSTANLIATIPIPGGSAGAGNNMSLPQGVNFSSAFTIVVTGNFAATSTGTTHSAGDVVGTFYFV